MSYYDPCYGVGYAAAGNWGQYPGTYYGGMRGYCGRYVDNSQFPLTQNPDYINLPYWRQPNWSRARVGLPRRPLSYMSAWPYNRYAGPALRCGSGRGRVYAADDSCIGTSYSRARPVSATVRCRDDSWACAPAAAGSRWGDGSYGVVCSDAPWSSVRCTSDAGSARCGTRFPNSYTVCQTRPTGYCAPAIACDPYCPPAGPVYRPQAQPAYDYDYWRSMRPRGAGYADPRYATTYDTSYTKDERYTPVGARFAGYGNNA